MKLERASWSRSAGSDDLLRLRVVFRSMSEEHPEVVLLACPNWHPQQRSGPHCRIFPGRPACSAGGPAGALGPPRFPNFGCGQASWVKTSCFHVRLTKHLTVSGAPTSCSRSAALTTWTSRISATSASGLSWQRAQYFCTPLIPAKILLWRKLCSAFQVERQAFQQLLQSWEPNPGDNVPWHARCCGPCSGTCSHMTLT